MRDLILLSVLLLALGACQKTELPEPVQEEPLFVLDAELDGQPLALRAGEADYYLFTEYRQEQLGIYSFVGRLEKTSDCLEDCAESFELEIRDRDIPPPGNVPMIELSVPTGNYPFNGPDFIQSDTSVAGYEVVWENRSTSNVPLEYLWDFGDNSTSTLANPPTHWYDSTIAQFPPEVSLQIREPGTPSQPESCEDVLSKILELPASGSGNPEECRVSIAWTVIDTLFLNFCANMEGGSPPYSFIWRLEDSSEFSSTCLPILASNFNQLQLIGTDANGCTASRTVNLQSNPIDAFDFSFCSADFSYTLQEVLDVTTIVDTLHLGQVTLRYTDPTGELFQSDLLDQGPNSFFEITEVRDYERNENGEPTRLLKIRFAATLTSAAGNTRVVENGLATMAIAYPEP